MPTNYMKSTNQYANYNTCYKKLTTIYLIPTKNYGWWLKAHGLFYGHIYQELETFQCVRIPRRVHILRWYGSRGMECIEVHARDHLSFGIISFCMPYDTLSECSQVYTHWILFFYKDREFEVCFVVKGHL